jgi:hypothetical protein
MQVCTIAWGHTDAMASAPQVSDVDKPFVVGAAHVERVAGPFGAAHPEVLEECLHHVKVRSLEVDDAMSLTLMPMAISLRVSDDR